MSNIEQFYKNCKIFREQLTQIEQHIKAHNTYTAFDFVRLRRRFDRLRSVGAS